MVKYFGLLKRKPGLTHEQFLKHWTEVHAPLALKYAPRLRKYVQNHGVQLPGVEFEYDGIAELWFDDVESALGFEKWLRSEQGRVAREDGKLFVGGSVGFVAEEVVFR